MKILGALILLIAFHSDAAAYNLELFKERISNPATREYIEFYLTGVGNGYGNANARLEMKGEPLIYCQPRNLTLNPDNYISLIQSIAERYDVNPNQDVAVLLLMAVEQEFPCQ